MSAKLAAQPQLRSGPHSLDSAVPEKVIWALAGDKGGRHRPVESDRQHRGRSDPPRQQGHHRRLEGGGTARGCSHPPSTRMPKAWVDACGFAKNFGYRRFRRQFVRNKKKSTNH